MSSKHNRFLFIVFTAFLAYSSPSIAQTGKPSQTSSPKKEEANISLSFVNADIDSVVKAVAKATGQTILIDPKVKGSINLVTEQPLTKAKTMDALSTALRLQGFAIVEANGTWRVLTEADARLQGTTINTGKTKLEGDQIITQVFKLNYESANNLIPVLKPLISPNNSINAYPGNNTIVITDYASNIQRIAKLISSIDNPTTGEVQTIKIKHALAIDIAAILNKALDTSGTGVTDAALKTIVMADARSNTVLLRSSNDEKMRQAKLLISKLDAPGTNNGNIWVVPLKNAEAAKLAITLRAIVAADASLSQNMSGTQTAVSNINPNPAPNTQANPSANSPTSSLSSTSNPSTGGIIQADPTTNSLIITASEPLYRNLRNVIEQLDTRRAQIYVESLIVEISSDKASELGIQWQGLINSGGNNVGFAGTNFGSGGNNIVGLGTQVNGLLNLGNTSTTSTVAPSPGMNLGLIHKYNGTYGLSALARALQTETSTNILSTPNLLTLDNEEARIVIGKNVPFITGQYAQTGTTTTVSPFQTIERKDVGITLKVRPQISENGLVKLQIYQEASSVSDSVNAAGIITNKRSIESNVLVDDGQIIALGGLMEDSDIAITEKVPLLGDIPGLGFLFRYETKKRAKTNLMVFLRPYVVRNGQQSDGIVANRYDYMRNLGSDLTKAPMLINKDFPAQTQQNQPPKKDPQSPSGDNTEKK
jgi:general secretion pathway protein D